MLMRNLAVVVAFLLLVPDSLANALNAGREFAVAKSVRGQQRAPTVSHAGEKYLVVWQEGQQGWGGLRILILWGR